ncbi:hypothetical protein [Pontibacter burrus]|uniref:Uncharacterized protein n=1 Tax=Pontibacter burrus TaxID=2704466 RepID=A0A6B3LRE5_9BACT|nr:hypothetical protein [Pontibacter burrus]NEM96064.1 hypothetical protein [Pontibacter burrus]
MKTKLLQLLSLAALLSCHSPNAQVENQDGHSPDAGKDVMREATSSPVDQAPRIAENEEYLDWNSVRINGKLPLTTSVKNIEGILGKADSVVSIDWNNTCSSGYRSAASKNAYFKGVEFEQFGDSLNFIQVNFSKEHNVFLQRGNLKLNHATTLEEVEKHFPNAVKDISKSYYIIDGKETDAVNLPPSKELTDRQWILMFQDGKLIRIDNWLPC